MQHRRPSKRLALLKTLVNENHLLIMLLRSSWWAGSLQLNTSECFVSRTLLASRSVRKMDFRAVNFLFCVICLVRCSPEQSSTNRKNGKKGKQKIIYDSTLLSGYHNSTQHKPFLYPHFYLCFYAIGSLH